MQSHRILSGLTVFVMVLLVAAGWFLIAQPQLAAASAASAQLVGVNTQIAQSQATIAQLKVNQKKLPQLKAVLAALRQSIPGDVQAPAYIDSLTALAASTGVSITAIKVSDAVAYMPPAIVTPTPTGTATASPSASPTPSATASAAPVATGPVAWTPTSDALITGANFVAIPVVVIVSGTFPSALSFISGLHEGKRLFLVSGISTSQDASSPGLLSTEVDGYLYVILDAKGDAAATSTTTTTPAATPTPTATPTVTPNPSGSSTPTPTTSPTP